MDWASPRVWRKSTNPKAHKTSQHKVKNETEGSANTATVNVSNLLEQISVATKAPDSPKTKALKTASELTGIPISVLKAESNKAAKNTPQTETIEPLEQKLQTKKSDKPSGTLEIFLPCLDEAVKIDEVESFEDDDSYDFDSPVIAKHWIKNMELLGKEQPDVSPGRSG